MTDEYRLSVRTVATYGFDQWEASISKGGHPVTASRFWSEAYARRWADRQIRALLSLEREGKTHGPETSG